MKLLPLITQAIDVVESGKTQFNSREKYIMGLVALKFKEELEACSLLGSFSIISKLEIIHPKELLEFLKVLKSLHVNTFNEEFIKI